MSGNARKFALGLRGLVLIPAVVLLGQCDRKPVEPEPARPIPAEPASEPSPAPPTTAMNRAELLAAVAAAASAHAAGERPEGTDPLIGRAFSIRIAFGCGGPAPEAAPTPADGLPRANWGRDQETIALSLTPGDWKSSPLIAGAGSDWEAVEGFWIPRPWQATATCPPVSGRPVQDPAPASPQTVGLAAVFSPDDSRVGRRNGRAYGFTIRQMGETPLTPRPLGYHLVLEGRLAAFPDGRAVHCGASGPDQRPVCIAAIRLDRVAFIDAGGLLSEWRAG